MTRKSYYQRYPLRAKFQATIAVIALTVLALPYLPKVSISFQPAMASDGIQRGSGRAD